MLIQYLQGAIQDLHTLISYTQLDIQAIKRADHDEIFARNIQKDALIKEFEIKRSLLDQEVRTLMEKDPRKNMAEVIGQEAVDLFGVMRESLNELKRINSDYARMVFAVSEFFTSLMDRLIPKDLPAYGENRRISTPKQASFLQVQA